MYKNEKTKLGKHLLFNGLSCEQTDRLLQCGKEKNYLDGKTIFYKGDPGNSLMILLQGEVKICSISAEGKEIVLNVIKSGEVFGEIAFIDGLHRTANAVAKGACTILVIERKDTQWLLDHLPDAILNMMTVMCERLRKTSEITENLALFTIPVRLARLLLDGTSGQGRTQTQKGTQITLRLSQSEIGSRIGATRESINKHLSKWKAQNWIELDIEYGYVTILNREALEQIAVLQS